MYCKNLVLFLIISVYAKQNSIKQQNGLIEVYSKSVDYISVKLKIPATKINKLYTNVLDEKLLIYVIQQSFLDSEYFQCQIWTNCTCFTINDLKPNRNYTIMVDVNNHTNVMILAHITTEKSAPESPLNLKIDWYSNDSIKLAWEHPFKTNGDLQAYLIEFQTGKTSVFTHTYYLTKELYNKTYFYNMNATIFDFSTEYVISVRADNGIKGKAAIVREFSPPRVPKFDFVFKTRNASIKIVAKAKFSVKNEVYMLIHLENVNKSGRCRIRENVTEITIPNNGGNCNFGGNFALAGNVRYKVIIECVNEFRNKTKRWLFLKEVVTVDEGESETLYQMFMYGFYISLLIPFFAFLYLLQQFWPKCCRKAEDKRPEVDLDFHDDEVYKPEPNEDEQADNLYENYII